MRKLFVSTLLLMVSMITSAQDAQDNIIEFEVEAVKNICVANWDTNGDGELSYQEAAAVTDLKGVFSYKYNWSVTKFNEFQYFTGLTSIPYAAFAGCRALTQITLPETVTSIGKMAFAQCGLTSFTVPDHVVSIGSYAFQLCSKLLSFKLSKSVTDIGSGLFSECSFLTSIQVEEDNPMYDSRNGCNAIIDSRTNSLIAGCKNSVIPDGIVAVKWGAFERIEGLTSLVIPKSLIYIDIHAIEYCNLNTISVEEGNPWYDSRNNCNAVIETATNTLVLGCKNTVIPQGVTAIGDWSFTAGLGLTNLEIPNSVTSIGESAFISSDFSSITIPANIESIGFQAFHGCENLTSLEVPEGVTSIGGRSFSECSSLISLTFPSSLTKIGDYAFASCWAFNSLTVNWKTPLAVNEKVFDQVDLSSVTLYVPKGTRTLYEAADIWKDFKEVIETESEGGLVTTQKIGDLYYILTSSTNKATVTGNPDPEEHYSGEIVIPETVEYEGKTYTVVAIGDKAFNECQTSSVSIPNSVTSIGEEAFMENGLTSITIPNSVKSIGGAAFMYCNLQSITIPKSVINLGSHLLMGCFNLSTISVDEDNPVYDSRGGCNAIIKTNSNSLISGCTNSFIPNTVTSIGYYAFSLTGLQSITLPNSIRSFEESAFAHCYSLKRVNSLIQEPFTFANGVFSNYNIPLYVPSGTIAKYKSTSSWNSFKEIYEIGELTGDFNDDGKVNKDDLTELVNYILGQPSKITSDEVADIKKDGKVNAADVVYLVDIILSQP